MLMKFFDTITEITNYENVLKSLNNLFIIFWKAIKIMHFVFSSKNLK